MFHDAARQNGHADDPDFVGEVKVKDPADPEGEKYFSYTHGRIVEFNINTVGVDWIDKKWTDDHRPTLDELSQMLYFLKFGFIFNKVVVNNKVTFGTMEQMFKDRIRVG